jgi:hypothetical protein
VLTDYTVMLFEHSSLAGSALVTRPHGENYLNLVESLLAALAGLLVSGEPGERLSWGFRALINGIAATHADPC